MFSFEKKEIKDVIGEKGREDYFHGSHKNRSLTC